METETTGQNDVTDDLEGGLSPPQYGMRHLLLFMVVVALLLVALKTLDPILTFSLILLALSVFAHVAGNAIGTKLRDSRSTSIAPQGTTRKAEEHHYAKTTELSQHQPLGLIMRIVTGISALAGAIGGGWFLASMAGEKATVANITLATLSCGVLGGLFGFWLSSFLQIAISAIWEAQKET